MGLGEKRFNLPQIQVDDPVILYDVIGMGGKYQLSLPEEPTDPFAILDPPLPINCFPLDGKAVSESSIPGYITHMGGIAAQVSLEKEVAVHSNLKILLMPHKAPGLSEAYSKVVSLEQQDPVTSRFRVRLEFTWLPEDAKEFLEKRLSTSF